MKTTKLIITLEGTGSANEEYICLELRTFIAKKLNLCYHWDIQHPNVIIVTYPSEYDLASALHFGDK